MNTIAPVATFTSPLLAANAWIVGIVALIALWAVCGIFASWDIQSWWCGADGKPSTSKFQLFLWTTVVLYVYITITARYVFRGAGIEIDPPCGTLPTNILTVLGFSGATAAVAKGITVGYLNAGRLHKPPAGTGDVFTADDGGPDLNKLQITAWTCVAIVVYLIQFARVFKTIPKHGAPGCDVPDIDTTLMVLMGLSQGAYLGKKLVTTDTPRITSVAPVRGPSGTIITLQGAAFGDAQNGSAVLIDGQSTPVAATWSDAQLTFRMPTLQPSGIPWAAGPHTVSLIVGGRTAAGAVTFTLTQPAISSLAPGVAKPGDSVTLYGFFGAPDPANAVLLDSVPLTAGVSWTQEMITFIVPAQHPNGVVWTHNQNVTVSIRTAGMASNTMTLSVM
jgi:hypothetical protein